MVLLKHRQKDLTHFKAIEFDDFHACLRTQELARLRFLSFMAAVDLRNENERVLLQSFLVVEEPEIFL